MKKSLVAIVTVSAVLFGLGTTQVFAKNAARQNPYGHPTGPVSERSPAPRFPAAGQAQKKNNAHFQSPDLLGEVIGINAEAQTLTVKDADGKETIVHVNPFSRLMAMPAAPTADKKEPARKGSDSKPEKKVARLTFSDVKTGDYVAVKKMKSETKTIEAAHIVVVQKK